MSEEVAGKLNVGRMHANRNIITADGNESALTKVAESVHVNAHGIVMPAAIFLGNSASV